MKSKLTILVVALFAVLLTTSCGSSKESAKKTDFGQKLDVEECIALAEDPNATGLRAWGEGRDFNQGDAAREAALMARGNLATSIATLIEDGIERYNEKYTKSTSDGQVTAMVLESAGKNESKIKGAAEALLKGSKVIKSTYYKQPDGTIKSYSCVEVDFNSISNYVLQSNELRSLISNAEKKEITKDSREFDESMKDAFNNLKKQR
jgi:hypothetical protein